MIYPMIGKLIGKVIRTRAQASLLAIRKSFPQRQEATASLHREGITAKKKKIVTQRITYHPTIVGSSFSMLTV